LSDEEVLTIEEKLGDYFADLEVNEEKINEQMSRQATSFVYYARIAALCRKKVLEKDLELKKYEASQAKVIRGTAVTLGEKPTVQSVQDEMRSTETWERLSLEHISLKADLDLAEAIREAFFQRKSMLEEFAKSLRKEMDGDTFLKKRIEDFKTERVKRAQAGE